MCFARWQRARPKDLPYLTRETVLFSFVSAGHALHLLFPVQAHIQPFLHVPCQSLDLCPSERLTLGSHDLSHYVNGRASLAVLSFLSPQGLGTDCLSRLQAEFFTACLTVCSAEGREHIALL